GAGAAPRLGVRRLLVVAQVALSFVLLVGALLFTRSFRNIVTDESGFREEGVVVMDVDLTALQPEPGRRLALADEVLERVRATPGVESASTTAIIPVLGSVWNEQVWMDGRERDPRTVNFNRVSPGYFKTLGTPLLAGRDFGAGDKVGAPDAAIVTEAFARTMNGGANPVGLRFKKTPERPQDPDQVYEVVGLVRDSKYRRLQDDFQPIIFLAADQEPKPGLGMTVVARMRSDDIPSLRRAVGEVAPAAIVDPRPWSLDISESLTRERLLATLSGFFGLLAGL